MEKKQTAVDWLLENLNEYNLEQVAVMAREKEARIIELAYIDGAIDMAELRTSSGIRYFKDNYGSI
jgi:hypothetical protein